MAKSKGKKKSKKSSKKRRADENTIEILLPEALHDRVMQIRQTDPNFINETIRAVFDGNELFGISAVRLNPARPKGTGRDPKGSYYKLCEG